MCVLVCGHLNARNKSQIERLKRGEEALLSNNYSLSYTQTYFVAVLCSKMSFLKLKLSRSSTCHVGAGEVRPNR